MKYFGDAQGHAKEFAAEFNDIGIHVGRIGFIIGTKGS
jgi:hypothetical protein